MSSIYQRSMWNAFERVARTLVLRLLITFTLGFFFIGDSGVLAVEIEEKPAKEVFSCGKPRKLGDFPKMEDGFFKSHLAMDCVVEKAESKGVEHLALSIMDHLKKTRVIHSGPQLLTPADLARRVEEHRLLASGSEAESPSVASLGRSLAKNNRERAGKTWILDTSVSVGDSGEKVKIREEVEITVRPPRGFSYKTLSQDIQAQGLASYLKHVEFLCEIQQGPDGEYRILLENKISVKRPWYALAPVFYLISKGVAEDKFLEAQKRLTGLVISLL